MKRMKGVMVVFLLITMMFFLLVPTINNQAKWDDTDDFRKSIEDWSIAVLSSITPPSKIHVDGNWSETAAIYDWCTGSGTYNDPYTIRDLVINVNGRGYGILIENTMEYFRIENCTIFNSARVGIKLYYVENGKLIHNSIYNNVCPSPLFVEDGDGIHLYYCNENIVVGNNCTGNSGDGIHLYRCNENIVVGNNCTGNDNGIRLDYCFSNNTVTGNSCTGNSNNGIYLTRSYYNTISYNNCTMNSDNGIYLYYSDYNNIINNNCMKNSDYGIYLYRSSHYNEVCNNFLIKNTDGCLEDLGKGNNIYNNTCVLVLITSFGVNATVIEVGQSVEFTDRTSGGNVPLVYQWNFGDGSLNSTARNPVHQYVSLGTYEVILIVTDADKDISIKTRTIFVRDTTIPTLITSNDIAYEQDTTDHNIAWIAIDLCPATYIVFKDDLEVASGNWTSNSSITINIDGLLIGSYNYTIVVFDTSGNSVSDTVIVTVVSPTAFNIAAYPFIEPLIAIILVAVMVLKRKSVKVNR